MRPHQLASLRAERLIAGARVGLAALLLLAIWLDPHEPSRLPPLGYAVGALYVAYSLVTAAAAWAPQSSALRWRHVTHVIDLLAYTAIIFFTDGATSPFFVFLLFALFAAALRWQWIGVVATAGLALASYAVIAATTAGPAPMLTIVIRSTYLTVFAILFGFLGHHYRRLQHDLDALATWPSMQSSDPSALSKQLLERLTGALAASEAAIVWCERDSTMACVTGWSAAAVTERRLMMPMAGAMVAPELAGRAFVTTAGRDVEAPVLFVDDGTVVRRWRGAALGKPLLPEVPAGPLLSLPLDGEWVDGRIFAGRRRPFADEDLVLGQLLLRQVLPQLDRACEGVRERRDAALQERVRLAQDLHDGVIQSLTGASLRLQTIGRLLEERPAKAHELLAEVDELLVAEQQELRWFMTEQRTDSDWMERLRQLTEHMARNWSMTVWMDIQVEDVLEGGLGHETYRIVQEALVNAARHGAAQSASVRVRRDDSAVELVVEDDGRGFPFRGDYDDAALREKRLGPVSIKQRIGALGGELRIRSHEDGARLEARLPLPSRVP
jgi:signal transduction histidine kinase